MSKEKSNTQNPQIRRAINFAFVRKQNNKTIKMFFKMNKINKIMIKKINTKKIIQKEHKNVSENDIKLLIYINRKRTGVPYSSCDA